MRKIPKLIALALTGLVLAGCSTTATPPVEEPAPTVEVVNPLVGLDPEVRRWVDLTNEVFGDCFTTFGDVESYDFYEDEDSWSVGILYIYFYDGGRFTFAVGTNEAGQDVTVAYG